MVKKIELIKRNLPFGRQKYFLAPEQKIEKPSRSKVNEKKLTFFVVVKTLNPGDYFGVGEPMEDLYVITKEKVM